MEPQKITNQRNTRIPIDLSSLISNQLINFVHLCNLREINLSEIIARADKRLIARSSMHLCLQVSTHFVYVTVVVIARILFQHITRQHLFLLTMLMSTLAQSSQSHQYDFGAETHCQLLSYPMDLLYLVFRFPAIVKFRVQRIIHHLKNHTEIQLLFGGRLIVSHSFRL